MSLLTYFFTACNNLAALPQTFYVLGEMMDLKMLSVVMMDDGGDEEKKKLMIMY